MANSKAMNQKSIRISGKDGGKTPEQSYVQGAKLTKTPKPKSLTPRQGKGK